MKSILVILFCLLSLGSIAQSASKPTGNCYLEWYTLFQERGAGPIADGTNDVIISITNGDYWECFLGKVDVASGRIAGKLQIQKLDGTYEEFNKKVSEVYQNSEGTLKAELRDIYKGMSTSVSTTDGEAVRLFFYKALLPKAKGNKKAPAPSSIIKD